MYNVAFKYIRLPYIISLFYFYSILNKNIFSIYYIQKCVVSWFRLSLIIHFVMSFRCLSINIMLLCVKLSPFDEVKIKKTFSHRFSHEYGKQNQNLFAFLTANIGYDRTHSWYNCFNVWIDFFFEMSAGMDFNLI